MKNKILVSMLMLITGVINAQPWTYDFGSSTGSFSTASSSSTTLLPAPTSGTDYVYIGSGGGSINLESSGTGIAKLGSSVRFRGVAPTSTSVNKASVYTYTASREFYVKMSILLGDNNGGTTATSGVWYFVTGKGSSFSDNSSINYNHVFGGLRFTFGASGAITAAYRNGSSWTNLTSGTIAQGNTYTIELIGNNRNGNNTVNYTHNGTAETAPDNKYDLYINGQLIIDDANMAGLGNNSDIDSWMFVGESSTSNVANIFVDDITYTNDVLATISTTIPYYSKSTGDVSQTANWTTNLNGTGTCNPTNFSTNNQEFILVNNTTPTITNDWTVTGTSSKVVVGDGSTSTTFTIPTTNKVSGTVDVTSNATLTIQNDSLPTLGTLATGSTVEFNQRALAAIPETVYDNLKVNNATGLTLNGNATVNGTLNLASGVLEIGSHTLTINGSVSGSGSLKGGANANLTIGGTGALGSINFSQTNPGVSNRIQNLTLNRGTSAATGSVALGNAVQVSGTVTLTNGTLNTGGNLVLTSDATTTGRIAAIPATADITGNITQQRYVPAVTRRYRMISPSVSSFSCTDLIDDIFVTGPGGSTNGFDNSTTNSSTVFTYQESTTGGRGWKGIPTINATHTAGNGLYVFVRGDRTLSSPAWFTPPFVPQNEVTIDFTGTPNKGNISPTLTYTNTGIPDNDGWNLVGNPYPSQIDWNLVTKSNLNSFIYVYDPLTNAYVTSDGSTPIAVGQAFFVQANAASPSITFTESCKVGNSPTAYFKSGQTNRLTIKMVRDSLNSDIAWMRFVNGSSINYNSNEDAIKFANSGINMGFKVPSNGTNVQLNTVPPLTGVSDTFVVFANAAANSYTLEFSQLQNISSTKAILLKDLFTNTITDVRANQIYPFSITSNAASQGERFRLIIIDQSALPVDFIQVQAKTNANHVDVTWATASETNNEKFVIERSFDGVNFEEVGYTKGNGTTQQISSYQFTDVNAISAAKTNGVNALYYRIRQVDFSGKSAVSKTAIAYMESITNNEVMNLFPNPAHAVVTLSGQNPIGHIMITDITGKTIEEFNTNLNEININLSGYQSGMYMVKTSNGISQKLIVE